MTARSRMPSASLTAPRSTVSRLRVFSTAKACENLMRGARPVAAAGNVSETTPAGGGGVSVTAPLQYVRLATTSASIWRSAGTGGFSYVKTC